MSVAEARGFLERHGLAAHRDRGQNFLHDEALADKLVRVAGVGEGDCVIEVGTGLGILTRALAARARRVVSVEIDAGLVRALRAEGALPDQVELLHADALELDWPGLVASQPGPVRVVANLPYSVATPLMRGFLDLAGDLEGWAVMIQKELAVRLAAEPGSRDFGSFSVLHRLVAQVDGSLDVHPRCFHPVPRVTSTFLTLSPLVSQRLGPDDLRAVERVVRAAFNHRRKTLPNALQQAGGFEASQVQAALARQGLDARSRAESIPPGAWLKLARDLPISKGSQRS